VGIACEKPCYKLPIVRYILVRALSLCAHRFACGISLCIHRICRALRVARSRL